MPVPRPEIELGFSARDWTDRDGQEVKKIILHATAGTNSLGWLRGNARQTSIHVLITKTGLSYKMLDESKGANHVGYGKMTIGGITYSRFSNVNCNQITLGIELENLNDGRDPYPVAQLRAAAWWVQEWLVEHNLSRDDVIMHASIDTQDKTDARGISVQDVLKYLDEPTPDEGQSATALGGTPILGPVLGSPEIAARYLGKRGTDPTYTSADHLLIARYYWAHAASVGVAPLMAFAQMIHETGGLTSWWCLRPRRNPAGLGVTGNTDRRRMKPPTSPGIDWQLDQKSQLWKQGLVFADWSLSVKAHIGHLLLYALLDKELNQAQRMMIAFDARSAGFPSSYRGVRVWSGLDGRWAVPGNGYSERIAAIAATILKGS